MNRAMSQQTRVELLAQLRRHYVRAGRPYRRQLLDQAVRLLGYHRKAAIRALRAKARLARVPGRIWGRPRLYDPERLLPILRPIWLTARQPCGKRLKALLPEWLPAYETDHRRLDSDVRHALLSVSDRTLDRLIAPLRVSRGAAGTRPGNLLRQSIPIRGTWEEEGPGWLEVDTVALCGGALDDRHLWMLDAVDIQTLWTEMRALPSRGQQDTLDQIRDLETHLPFPICGIDCDNGGEFLNHHLIRYFHVRPTPVLVTRSRPYRKNDNAHVEQRNWTHVREEFGYERYDNPAVVSLINALCKGPLGQLQNHWLPSHKLDHKRVDGSRTVRIYGPPQTPYARLLASPRVSAQTKKELVTLHAQLNPFQMARDIEKQKKQIEAHRLMRG